MTRTPLIAPLIAAFALTGCSNDPVVLNPDGTEANAAQDAAVNSVTLPPSIVASHKYRCKDNSLISIDWLSDGTVNSARVTPEGGAAVELAEAATGGEYTAHNMTVLGDPKAASIKYQGQTCTR